MSDHRLAAGVVVVRRSAGGWRYLLLRVYGYWDFPKGEVEPDEEPLDAACREVAEETGLQDLRFVWGREFYETERYGHGKIARYYLARSDNDRVVLAVNPQLGHPEHHEYRWVSADQAEALLNARVGQALHWARARIAAEAEGDPSSQCPKLLSGNLFEGLTCPATGERFEELLSQGRLRIERIVSSSEPEPTPYDQPQDEWVLLLEGRARIELDGEPLELRPGDWVFIPAHTRHRVLSTSPQPRCLWLAVHWS
jgi:bis(5'-nucleosidyl)-tetraphosphatase